MTMLLKAIRAQDNLSKYFETNKQHKSKLTDEEKQSVFRMTREGFTVGEIAEAVGIGYSTTYNYRRQEQRRMLSGQ